MKTDALTDLVQVVQMAVAPTILISGVGLLLLTMTNRLGRAIDRARTLIKESKTAAAGEAARLRSEVHILYQRSKLLRWALIMAVLSLVGAGLLIILLFVELFYSINSAFPIVLVFSASIVCLIASLGAFIADINLSLTALRLEIEQD